LILESDSFSKGLDSAEGRSSSFASKLGSLGAGVAKLGAAMALAGAVAFTGFLVDSAKSAIQSENAIAELDSVLKSTEASMTKAAEATGHWGTVTKASGEHVADWEKQLKSAQNSLSNLQAKQAAGIGLTEAEQKRMGSLQAAVQSYSGALSGATTTATVWFSTQEEGTKISHLSRNEYLNLASSLQKVTKFSDEAILGGESMLLTFTNIGKEVFPQATEATLNLAEKFGSVEAASVQIGKALNDPIAGVTALRKVGVSLTKQQEKQIKAFVKSGDVMSAQKIILKELETEFGGLARAMGNTTEGVMVRFGNAIDDIKERVGNALLPIMRGFLENVLIPMTPKVAKLAGIFADMVGAISRGADPLVVLGNGLQRVMLNLGFTGEQAQKVKDFFIGLSNLFTEIVTKAPQVVQWFKDLGQALLDMDTGKIHEMLDPIIEKIKTWVQAQSQVLSDKIKTEWGPALVAWLKVDAPVLAEKLGKIVGDISAWILSDGVTMMADAGKALINALFGSSDKEGGKGGDGSSSPGSIAEKIVSAFVSGWKTSLDAHAGEITAAFTNVITSVGTSGATMAAVGALQSVGGAAVTAVVQGIIAMASNPGVALVGALGGALLSSWGIVPKFFNVGSDIVDQIARGVSSVAGKVSQAAHSALGGIGGAIEKAKTFVGGLIGSFQGLWDWLNSHVFNFNIKLPNLPSWAIPGSPTPFEMGLRGINDALKLVASQGMPDMNMGINGGMGLNPAMAAVPSGGGSGSGITINGNIVLNDVGNKNPEQVADEFLQQVGRKLKQFRRSGATNLGAG